LMPALRNLASLARQRREERGHAAQKIQRVRKGRKKGKDAANKKKLLRFTSVRQKNSHRKKGAKKQLRRSKNRNEVEGICLRGEKHLPPDAGGWSGRRHHKKKKRTNAHIVP